MLAGHLGEAHTLAERALALARGHQHRGHQAYALRLLGEMAARIRGHHLTSGVEILRLRRHHTPHTRQRPDHPIEILFIPTAARPGIELHLHYRTQEKPL